MPDDGHNLACSYGSPKNRGRQCSEQESKTVYSRDRACPCPGILSQQTPRTSMFPPEQRFMVQMATSG